MQISRHTVSTDETEKLGYQLAEILDENGIHSAFIAMRGEMGVGKTAFTRGFASYYGIRGVKSPTYTVLNEYEGKASIHHFDFYRIADEDELYSVGFDDCLGKEGFCIGEWSENVESLLPEERITVSITRIGFESENENERDVEINVPMLP